MSLNIKQRKFIDNLFKGMGQKKAYEEAGYKPDDGNARRLTRNDKIAAEIQRQLEDIDRSNRLRLARISETALAELLVIIKNSEIDVKVKLDAIKDALDRAGLKPVERLAIGGDKKLEPIRIIATKEDMEFAKGKDG